MSINRLKTALIERGRTNKWLVEQLGKSETTVSRWCTNEVQPPLEILTKVTALLDVDIRELLKKQNKTYHYGKTRADKKSQRDG